MGAGEVAMQVLSCCPVVRKETMKLWIEIDVPGRRELVQFEREILWIRESSTELRLIHRGAEIAHAGSYNDFCGFLTSLENREGKDCFRRYKLKPGDTLQLVAACTITDTPHLEDKSPDAIEWNKEAQRKKYQAIGRDKWWFVSNEPAGKNAFGGPWYPRLEEIEVAKLENIVLGPGLPEVARKWVNEQRAKV